MTATIRVVDGKWVLDDPVAYAVAQAIGQINCKNTLSTQLDRVAHFVRRIGERGLSTDEVVIVILNVDDPHGGPVADKIPFARGLAQRSGMQHAVDLIDTDVGKRLRAIQGKPAVVVMDHGVVEVFEVEG
jgi:hypothetical protein